MPVAMNASSACVLAVGARLVSLNGGVVLAVAILLTAFFSAALLADALEWAQVLLLGAFMCAAWVYLLDSVTERLVLQGGVVIRSSFLQPRTMVPVTNMRQLLLMHEGLNQVIGIESLIVRFQDGREGRLPLGPCWRQRDLEAFVTSVAQVMKEGT